jgi:hypothetical protein
MGQAMEVCCVAAVGSLGGLASMTASLSAWFWVGWWYSFATRLLSYCTTQMRASPPAPSGAVSSTVMRCPVDWRWSCIISTFASRRLLSSQPCARPARRLGVRCCNPLSVLLGGPWERHAPAWLLEPGWSPAFPGRGLAQNA